MKHTKIYHITARFLLAAILLAVSWTSVKAAETVAAYAVLSDNNTVLTFYYDDQINSRGGMSVQDLGWLQMSSSVTSVQFDRTFASYSPESTSYWFSEMSQLQALDLSNLNMASVTNTDGMFMNSSRLTTIIVNDTWPAAESAMTPDGSSGVSGADMFNGCRSLVGGAGTTYDAQHIDYSYAHIDGGENNPGYFTASSTSSAEPYVVLDGTTLYFYYDDQKSSRGGMDINNSYISEGSVSPYGTATIAVFDASFANYQPTSTAYWFQKCSSLISIGNIGNLKTDNVTSMRSMFRGCSSLTSLDMRGFKTFVVTDMSGMFYDCSSLTDLDFWGFNTRSVTDIRYMFFGCSGLTSLGLSGFNTQNVSEMLSVFEGCASLTSLDLSSFNTQGVTNMTSMFRGCSNLITIYVGSEWTIVDGIESTDMFSGCTKLVGGAGTSFDASHTDAAYAHIDGGTSNPGYFTDKNTSDGWVVNGNFEGNDYSCFVYKLNGEETEIAVTAQDVVTDSEDATNHCLKVTTSPYPQNSWDCQFFVKFNKAIPKGETIHISLRAKASDAVNIAYEQQEEPFVYITTEGTLDLSTTWNTYQLEITSQSDSFKTLAFHLNGYEKEHVDFYFDDITITLDSKVEPYAVLTDNGSVVTDGEGTTLSGKTLTFYYDDQKAVRGGMEVKPFTLGTYNGVWSVNSGWSEHAAAITTVDFDESFANCTTLTSTDYWFYSFSNLTTVRNIENLKTPNVTTMECMFGYCSSLTSLDLSSLNTDNVTSLYGMLLECTSLKTLDLSGFNTSKVTNMNQLFYPCSSLKTIYVGSGWSTEAVTEGNYIFNGCTSLVGGAGTRYDSNHVDKTYARIDGGTSAPGYFTEKNAANPSTDEHNLYPAKNIVWGDITWKNAHNSRDKDNNYMPFLMGSGLGYKTLLAESFYSEEQGANITRPYYTYVDYEAGETGVPGYGLYYKFTPKTSGQLRFNTWVNKGNRKTFVVKGSTGAALEPYVDYTFDGYVNGQNNITDGVSYPIYFTADEIKARHDESGTVNKYVVDKGNQIFWGWITLNVEAGESYYIYQQTSQLGFGGYDFIPTGGTAESYVSCIRSTTDDTFALSSEFAAVVDENGKATNVTERGSFVRFGTTNMDVEALGSSTPISVEADLDIQPYAVLSDNNTVLTFYYDDQKSARGGMDIGPFAYLEHGFGESQRPWHDVRESIVYAVIDPSMSQYTSLVSTGWWFYGCTNLKSVSGWGNLHSESIVDMWGTFEYCSSLPSDPAAGGPDFSNFKSPNLKRTVCMFHGCTSMTSLDLSSLNTANVTENEAMFNGCTALTTIYVGSGWDMSNATDNWVDNMFLDCTSLVGGAGTRYDANNYGTSYAHIDGGASNPGYLTELIRKTLTADDYFEWTGMKANATKKSESPYPNCYYILGQSAEIPYGEPDVNPYTYADVSAYDRLEVTATGNTPRILLNRDSVGGQWNEDEALSHMIESTQSGWSSKYFSHSGNVWTVDLKQIVADKGFAHLNGIKGDNWSAVTVIKIELVKINSTATAGNATFDDHLGVLTVEGDLTMQQAVEQAGGRQSLAERIRSIVWNSSVVLTESDLDGFTNPNMLIFVGNKDKTTLTRNNVVIEGKARKVVLSDVASGNGDFRCPQEFFADSIIYTHNYKQATEIGVSRGWETIALPFDVQTITHEKNGVIAPFGSSASDKHFWLRTLVDEQGLARATKIEANHAYLISMPNNGKYPAEYNLAGNVTFATAGVVVPETIYRASQLTTDNGRIILMPNFLRLYASEYYYVLNVGEARDGHPEGSVFEVNYRETLPFQAFTYHEGNQNPSRFISLDELMEGTTGIETIEQPQWSGAEQWWSIDGRKLNGKPSQKGVYIRNGKKVVVKATF
ncbi:MAG: BspA family leucine-rich repeat surface protein [Prevotella sp.]|nr:BspA family leucine-rich repeat surface protein [Prevotella sp.]